MEENPAKRLIDAQQKAMATFGWSFGTGMALLTAIGLWRHFPNPVIIITGSLSFFHFVSFLFFRKALRPTFLVIGFLGKIVGSVFSFLVFTLVYYTFFTFISLILRLCGKDLIGHNRNKPLWIDIPEEQNNPERITKLY